MKTLTDFEVEQKVQITNYKNSGLLRNGSKGVIKEVYDNSCLVFFYDCPQKDYEVSKRFLQ